MGFLGPNGAGKTTAIRHLLGFSTPDHGTCMINGMDCFHLTDPIRFDTDLHVEIQALGWRSEGRYLPLQDDIASVGYWYQLEPHKPVPPLPDANALEVN